MTVATLIPKRRISALAVAALFGASLLCLFHGRAKALAARTEPPRRSFVYTILNPSGPNQIAAFERNPDTGELVFIGTYPTGGSGTGRIVDSQRPLALSPDLSLLFAVNPGSNDISVMRIAADGSLALLHSPVASRGVQPASVAVHQNLLYVATKGDATNPPAYSGFRVADDGSLTRIRRRITLEIGDNPTQVLFSRDGTMLIGLRFGSGGIDCFSVNRKGKLNRIASLENQRGPFAAGFNPLDDSHLIVADARLPGAAGYSISTAGQVSLINSAANAPERAACWIALRSDGNYAWISNTGTNSISLYSINSNGTISLASSHGTAAFGRTPFELALDGENRFLYQLNVGGGNQSIHALRLTGETSNAGVEDVSAIGLPAGGVPCGLVVAGN